MRRRIVAVVGPGELAPATAIDDARRVGVVLAESGFVVLTGGGASGVMDAASRGAREAGGLSLGLLPGGDADESSKATIPIPTGLGEARNAVIAHACDAMIVCGMNPGTASEIALALKVGKPVILVGADPATVTFFQGLDGRLVHAVTDAEGVVDILERVLMKE